MSVEDYLTNVFTFGRYPPLPPIYPENKTAVTVDVLEVGWIVAFFTIYVCLMILLPGAIGKEKALYFVRITIVLFIGLVVMLCNFGQEWEVGELESKMFYKAGSTEEIDGKVSVKLGLRSVNVTLYADSYTLEGDLKGEQIDYNERFYWTWNQGRTGFGPFAGQIQRDFREAQIKGTPYPILWIAEYFTFDGEGLRFGRHYRHAGWYAHICVWCAFVSWILSAILFKVFIRYGAIMLSILGCFLFTSSLIWCSFRNFIELAIIFNNDDDKGVLRTHYGIHWYLALFVGLFCIVSGFIVALIDIFYHNELCKFFGVDPYSIIDEVYGENEVEPTNNANDIEMTDTKFGRQRQKTVMYKARGTKKHWVNTENDNTWDNEAYFDVSKNPTLDPEYIDLSHQSLNQFRQSNFQYNLTAPQPYQPHGAEGGGGGELRYDPQTGAYTDGEYLYQDTSNSQGINLNYLHPGVQMQSYDQQEIAYQQDAPPPRPPKSFSH